MTHYQVTAGNEYFYAQLHVEADSVTHAAELFRIELEKKTWVDTAQEEYEMGVGYYQTMVGQCYTDDDRERFCEVNHVPKRDNYTYTVEIDSIEEDPDERATGTTVIMTKSGSNG